MLSVIVPFCREWPQVVFTIRSIAEELWEEDFEVLAIDNLQPNMKEDRASQNIAELAREWKRRGHEWLKYYQYQDKLSHWQCKNFAMEQAAGDFYLFIDAHCIVPKNSLMNMYEFYAREWEKLNGTIHLPLTYHILEPRQLIYKMVVNTDLYDYHYSFLSYPNWSSVVTQVPCMSTCGMMMHKSIMQEVGGWPRELGIYGGGENFMNFVLAVMGYKKWIYNGKSLYHHGDRRGYSWNYYDYQRNRAIATYMFGGRELMINWVTKNTRLSTREKATVAREAEQLRDQRELIKLRQVMHIHDFAMQWAGTNMLKGLEPCPKEASNAN